MSELNAATKLALDRTVMAHQRTLMAWIRTATSLISFGFGTYKFFEYLGTLEKVHRREIGPRSFAFLMISLGLCALIGATVQQRNALHALEKEYGFKQPAGAIWLAVVMSVAAVALLILVMLRL